MHKLVTIAFSHYCEVARFALDRAGVSYDESPHLPFLHIPPAAMALRGVGDAQGDRVSSRFSTPILRYEEGGQPRVVVGSREILTHLLPELHDERDTDDLARMHDTLGPHTRRLAYGALLEDKEMIMELCRRNGRPAEVALFGVVFPFARGQLKRLFDIRPKTLQRSEERVREWMGWADERLEQAPYLAGERAGTLDIYFACLLAPSISITEREGYGVFMPELEDTPAEYEARARELRSRPAGQHALRIFREERRRGAST